MGGRRVGNPNLDTLSSVRRELNWDVDSGSFDGGNHPTTTPALSQERIHRTPTPPPSGRRGTIDRTLPQYLPQHHYPEEQVVIIDEFGLSRSPITNHHRSPITNHHPYPKEVAIIDEFGLSHSPIANHRSPITNPQSPITPIAPIAMRGRRPRTLDPDMLTSVRRQLSWNGGRNHPTTPPEAFLQSLQVARSTAHPTYEDLLELGEQLGTVRLLSEDDISTHLHVEAASSLPSLSEESHLCAICQHPIEIEEDVAVLNCKHVYHVGCIKRWLLQKNECPVCRRTGIDV